jgi:hypothetical protein
MVPNCVPVPGEKESLCTPLKLTMAQGLQGRANRGILGTSE